MGVIQFGTLGLLLPNPFSINLVCELALWGWVRELAAIEVTRKDFFSYFFFPVERGATYQGRAMGETLRPWPKPCRFTRILCVPCTSREDRTLLPHWIEESFPSPGSCTTQIWRKQGGRWGLEEYRRPCFYLQRGYRGGKRTSKTDYQPEISDSNLMSSTPLPILSHLTPGDQKEQH